MAGWRVNGSKRLWRAGKRMPGCRGVVSGYLFKIFRQSIGLTQVELAEKLGMDVATVQGWESGRRPLMALRAGDLSRMSIQLAALGVPPALFAVLHQAIDADLILCDGIEAGGRVIPAEDHPLAAGVHRRELTTLITWPFTGVAPGQLAQLPPPRRGPTSDRPLLGADERRRFFDHLLVIADAYRKPEHGLMRRQAIYLLGFDDRTPSAEWLVAERRHAMGSMRRWETVSQWAAVRSSAVSLARNGEPDALRAFIGSGLLTERQNLANLNYWSYWVGELSDVAADDDFMLRTEPRCWSGARLFDHLVNSLRPDSEQADMNIHTLWSLVAARPGVIDRRPAALARVRQRIEQTATDPNLTPRARQELIKTEKAVRSAHR
ncbi:XRE family transcriptional regulator [Pseudonocardiaceae bacterium YIM PH 21723]|nr:XRE family transcriptional regulator [Pseudonocardiaceae bacterium YIM PH 21723]